MNNISYVISRFLISCHSTCFRLDSIGKGGFSHDFKATQGEVSSIANDFDSFGDVKPSLPQFFIFLLAGVFPALVKVPTDRRRLHQSLAGSFGELATKLLEKARQEKAAGVNDELDKSILGALGTPYQRQTNGLGYIEV